MGWDGDPSKNKIVDLTDAVTAFEVSGDQIPSYLIRSTNLYPLQSKGKQEKLSNVKLNLAMLKKVHTCMFEEQPLDKKFR